MVAQVHFFPLGNADTLRLDRADGRKVLVDYAAMIPQASSSSHDCRARSHASMTGRRTQV